MAKDTVPRPPARRGRKPRPRALHLKITLAGIDPPIWRKVRVPDAYTLDQLHRVIQFAFGWLDYHLYKFRIGERRFEAPDEEAEDEDSTAVCLRDLSLRMDARFTYTYDFGDYWEHEIVVEGVYIFTPADYEPSLPVLLGGARAGPLEDCGGPDGYAQMLRGLADPRHPQHTDYRLWAGDHDPEQFDVRSVRNNLTLAAVWGAI